MLGLIVFVHVLLCFHCVQADLYHELSTITDLSEVNRKYFSNLQAMIFLYAGFKFRRMCDIYPVPSSYLKDSRTGVGVFAEVDDVYLRYPNLRSMSQNEVLMHFGTYFFLFLVNYRLISIITR